jgi:uncharacterized protein YbjT (DUF2867 family)
MSEKKIIAVVGATGAQGGGLARAVLADADGPFALRALTRNPTAARVAKDAGLRHVVWSTLEDTRPHFARLGSVVPDLFGGYKVPHFDAKGEANAAFTDLGVPTTFLQTTFYYESFIVGGQGPHRDERGRLALTIPMADAPMSLIAAEDIGRTAFGIFRRGSEFVGRTVSVAGAHATGEELAAKFTAVLGEEVVYRPLTHDEARAAGYPGAEEIGNMYQFYADASEYFTGARDLALVRELNPDLEPLDAWLAAHKDEIPLG